MPVVPEAALVDGAVYGGGVRNLAEGLVLNAGSEGRVRARAGACGRKASASRFRALAVGERSTGNEVGGSPRRQTRNAWYRCLERTVKRR